MHAVHFVGEVLRWRPGAVVAHTLECRLGRLCSFLSPIAWADTLCDDPRAFAPFQRLRYEFTHSHHPKILPFRFNMHLVCTTHRLCLLHVYVAACCLHIIKILPAQQILLDRS